MIRRTSVHPLAPLAEVDKDDEDSKTSTYLASDYLHADVRERSKSHSSVSKPSTQFKPLKADVSYPSYGAMRAPSIQLYDAESPLTVSTTSSFDSAVQTDGGKLTCMTRKSLKMTKRANQSTPLRFQASARLLILKVQKIDGCYFSFVRCLVLCLLTLT